MSESLARRQSGAPVGFKRWHLIGFAVLGILWFGLAAFVLTHGRGDASSVDVYSELPPGFTGQLEAHGVRYQGLSPVDQATQSAVLSRVPGPVDQVGATPLVFRTALVLGKGTGAETTNAKPALMVVVPQAEKGSSTEVFVEFVDPSTYDLLKTVEYGGPHATR